MRLPKLHKLEVEWLNFHDHNAQDWLDWLEAEAERKNRKRAEIDANQHVIYRVPPDKKQWWRAHFRSTREALCELEHLSWPDAVSELVGGRLARRADNPTFLALVLLVLDRRPVLSSVVIETCGLAHLNRTLERGGVMWSAHGDRIANRVDSEGLAELAGVYPVPDERCVLVRGKRRSVMGTLDEWSALELVDTSAEAPVFPRLWGANEFNRRR